MLVCIFAQRLYILQKHSYMECIEQCKEACHPYCYDGKQYALCNCWANFCKGRNGLACVFVSTNSNGCFTSQINFFNDVNIFVYSP